MLSRATLRTSIITPGRFPSLWLIGCLMAFASVARPAASATQAIVIDDFENGTGAWMSNDKVKEDNPATGVVLADVVPTRPTGGGYPNSRGAGLFTFKAGRDTWASASTRVDGAKWAQIGAQRLTFWLSGSGEEQYTEMRLRSRYLAPDGTTREEIFDLPAQKLGIRLNTRQWRKVVIPLSDFRSPNGALPPRMSGVYLFQFMQRGTWDSRFFTIDQLQVEGDGRPIAQAVVATDAMPSPTAPDMTAVPGTVSVSVDFLARPGKFSTVRTSANASIGAVWPSAMGGLTFPLDTSKEFREALQTLKPRFLRLDAGGLADLVDSSRPAFDFSRLQAAVSRARAIGTEPLIAISNPPAWGLDERGYALFALQTAQAVNRAGATAVRYFELPTGATTINDVLAVSYYNRAYAILKSASKNYRVGGITASGGRLNTMQALLRGATGLDFLSLQYFGAMAGQPSGNVLFAAARDVRSLRLAAAALDSSRWRNVPLYVTQSNLNATRGDNEMAPADPRTVRIVSAAWWISFISTASRVADQVFHNDAANPEWGLLDENSKAYPAYYALWMWNSFIPPGSVRVQAAVSSTAIAAVAANTPTAHNLLLVNTTENDVTARIGIRGFPVLRAARIRVLDDPQTGVRFEDLPKSPFQTITLKPYAVAALQFIEPPKR